MRINYRNLVRIQKGIEKNLRKSGALISKLNVDDKGKI